MVPEITMPQTMAPTTVLPCVNHLQASRAWRESKRSVSEQCLACKEMRGCCSRCRAQKRFMQTTRVREGWGRARAPAHKSTDHRRLQHLVRDLRKHTAAIGMTAARGALAVLFARRGDAGCARGRGSPAGGAPEELLHASHALPALQNLT